MDNNGYDNNNQQGYTTQPTYTTYQNQAPQGGDSEIVSVGEWVLTYIIYCIPCVGIIMYFVWAFVQALKRANLISVRLCL